MSGRLHLASSSAVRLAQISAFVSSRPPATEVILVAASRGAADDVARQVARAQPATFGLHRFSLTQLAARLAATRLAARGLAPATRLATEAVAARAVFEARRDGRLAYFLPVAGMPGFAPSLGRTLTDLRMSSADITLLSDAREGGRDLAILCDAAAYQFARGGTADRAALFAAASDALESSTAFCHGKGVALIDIALTSDVERSFVATLVRQASEWIAVAPADDERTTAALEHCGAVVAETAETAEDDLGRLRRYLFTTEAPALRTPGGQVTLYSAPGEGREAMEIARYALDEARRGVRFDEMAVLLRSPREYLGLLEHAFSRANVPGWFGRGTRRPHPAGRALLALLACADENLSAHRFAEYLSLAQVPDAVIATISEPPAAPRRAGPSQPSLFQDDEPIQPVDDALATTADRFGLSDEALAEPDLVPSAHESPDAPIVQGVVRAPYRWEEWLVESAVIAGRDRWTRLDGLAAEYRLRLREARRDDPHSPKVPGIERDLTHLEHLRGFALPLVREFDDWPEGALWGGWLDRLHELVPRVIRQPVVVQRVLAELRPMAAIGPVTLREVREVLADRLRTVAVEPPVDRYGRVFVGLAEQARGRAFRVVFVPGLAERVFPQKVREDPLLSDEMRTRVTADLETSSDRSRAERMLLRLAVGSATERLYLSYPRIELREARPRVPSFYGLDVMRAVTGRVPGHEELQAAAARETRSTLAWPAPADAARAVDDFEHDLAVLGPLLTARDSLAARGLARYLLDLNPHLRRSLTERWKRWKPAWTDADGLVTPTPHASAVLEAQRLGKRPYSLTALQRYSACPYQFLLSAIYRLEPLEEPTPVQRLDPLTKGGLFHAMQAAFFRAREAANALPVTNENLTESLAALDEVVARVSEKERDALAPAVDRVWRDEVASIRKDLRRWVMLQADGSDGWRPERFELSFGLPLDTDHDTHSVADPVTIDGRFILRGAIDLVERHATGGTLRVTDHKTGKNRAQVTTTVGGGKVLQPVLYSLVVESLTGEPVRAGRLYYCTQAGGFSSHSVELDPIARRTALQVLEVIDRGIERAFLAASPDAGACTYCDYRPVCGPSEEKRAGKKNASALADLIALRGLP